MNFKNNIYFATAIGSLFSIANDKWYELLNFVRQFSIDFI